MQKKFIALAIAGVLAAPVAASADTANVTVYGKAHMSIDHVDTGNSMWDVRSRASRLGFKGTEDLGDGLKAVYQMEFGVEMADRNNDINDGDRGSLSQRNTFIGLAGDWGTFVVGRHDTPFKISTGKLDLFGDEAADYNDTLGFIDARADNAVAYISPSMSGLTLAAAMVPAGTSTVFGGANANADGLAEAISVAAMYGNGPLYAALAYETYDQDVITSTSATPDLDMWRFGIGYSMDAFKVGFVYENEDVGADFDIYQLSAAYKFGNNVVKGMYGETDGNALGTIGKGDSWGIGLDHHFSKRTKVYAQYVEIDPDAAGVSNTDTFSVGMVHSF
ncbi:porin [Endothiovibrio diazotrophicus]